MRRATLVLASSLAAAAIAGALLYAPRSFLGRPGSPAFSKAVDVVPAEATPAQRTSPPETEPNAPAAEPTDTAVAQNAPNSDPPAVDRASRQSGPPPDEATMRERMRKITTQEVRDAYSLLLDDLGLTPQATEDLLAVLVELQLEAASSGSQRGRTIGAQERHDKIAAVIGDEKLDKLLLLELNRAAYWETQQIASLLHRKQVPLTETQRDEVFEILVEVRDRYPATEPPADLDRMSVEWIEHDFAQLDEFDRHVMELAPSVLTPAQVVHLFDEYQGMSRDRIAALEWQKKRRAERPEEQIGWFYPARWNPARWNPR